ncbi:hypothetical protein P152DRAFT_474446 [Eremomyces bilateralis CBS 781.70]|uniref:Uncharacterized protein n=1 Tax=Eremomyces bilateralis CBS 781.70 TaxID=1392243 RepID=A0A6G1G111_9PEZI|nr:uncharacterized protein P152DRAFT_474446 [Eremomyces bilateralis CBS 781.70]KAF1811723.1 hypothetical protein P152DRAFT_474446 [Eremomyces bilateralis CBS 781.70]
MAPKRAAAEVETSEAPARKSRDTGKEAESSKPKTKAEKRAEYHAESKRIEEKANSPEGLEYICLARPWQDREKEWEEDEDWEDEPSEEQMKLLEDEIEKYAEKPAEEHPEWKWIITRQGNYLANTYGDDTTRRNPDMMGMYTYNDHAGYGMQEVIENQLIAFKKEFSKKNCDPHRLWIHLEAMGLYFYINDQMGWHMLEDGECMAQTLALVGQALLTGLNVLERADLLKPDSKIKNIGLVVGLFLSLAAMHTDAMDDEEWPSQAIAYCKSHNVEIKGLYDSDELVAQADEGLDLEDFEDPPGPDRFNFKRMFKDLSDRYGPLGGSKYDIVKMSKKERIAASYDKEDPLDKADPDFLIH